MGNINQQLTALNADIRMLNKMKNNQLYKFKSQ